MVIDKDEATFNDLSPDFSGFRVEGDATQMAVLKEAKLKRADVLFATTHEDNVNLMVAQVARKIFNVPHVLARVFDPRRQQVFDAARHRNHLSDIGGRRDVPFGRCERPRRPGRTISMKVLIVGGGKTLYFLCRNFTAKGYEVVIINRNQEECVQLARQLSATVVCGDGSDPGILKEAGAMGADALLAITPNDQDNLVICQLASLQFGVPRAVALANDPENAEVFQKLGVSAFSTTHIIGSLIEQRASLEADHQSVCRSPKAR